MSKDFNLISHKTLVSEKWINENPIILNPNLGGGIFSSPCWFSFYNSGIVKAVDLGFYSIKWLFIKDIHDKFGIHHWPQSRDYKQNPDGGISDLRISGRIPYKQKLS